MALVIEDWPSLSVEARANIMTIVRASRDEQAESGHA
jgi:hypothetical protein